MINKIVNERNGRFYVTNNDNYLASVLTDLANNNTAFPEIVDSYEFMKDVRVFKRDKDGNVVKDKDGKPIKEKVQKKTLRVYFTDGSWTDVTKSDSDTDDNIVAFTYAITKRLFGTLTEGGYVVGDGFMNKLKTYASKTRSDERDTEEKKKRIKEKEAQDKKLHEEAQIRKDRNPSIGIRLHNLEEKFNKLIDILTPNKKK